MGDGFQVDPGAMRDHATRLDNLATQLVPAEDAARQMTLDTKAYGLPGMLLVPIINALQQGALEVITDCHDALTKTAEAVRGHAGSYEELGHLVTAGFDSMKKD